MTLLDATIASASAVFVVVADPCNSMFILCSVAKYISILSILLLLGL